MTAYRALFDLAGRTAVVTGGAGILGRPFCHGLAEFGAAVAVADIDGDAARALAGELVRDHGGRAAGIACDVSDPAAVAAMADAVEAALGPADILLNNAAGKTRDLGAFFAPWSRSRPRPGAR
ncbi:MAG TPA: SDR family NAD(P)-dependent oxidoreductase [Alphaproteobacteria bacterium]|nr:SDR family NAD(P)-dependent oxidoreductase [Alphaproteobacteria bacterium]